MSIRVLARLEFKRQFKQTRSLGLLACLVSVQAWFFQNLITQYQARAQGTWSIAGGGVTEDIVHPYLGLLALLLILFVPLITMSSFAAERKSHTLELLFKAPIPRRHILLGKMLAYFMGFNFYLVISFMIPCSLLLANPLDLGQLGTGILGLELLTLGLSTLGIFSSTLTREMTFAGLGLLAVLLFCSLLEGFISQFRYLSPLYYIKHFLDGNLKSTGLYYFICLALVPLILADLRLQFMEGT